MKIFEKIKENDWIIWLIEDFRFDICRFYGCTDVWLNSKNNYFELEKKTSDKDFKC